MEVMKSDVNMFLIHGKDGIFVNSCVPQRPGDSPADVSAVPSNGNRPEVLNHFSCQKVWCLDRIARLYSRSPKNNVAIVEERLGLSILHLNTECSSDSTFDTLRGVGKFRNLYTPMGCKNIKHLQWSNNGVYLVIYFNLNNFSKETGLSLDDNLHIWDISQKAIVGTFSTRRLSPEQWPIIKWVGDNDMFAFCYSHEVSLYSISSTDASPIKSTRLLMTIPVHRVFSVEVFGGIEGTLAANDTGKAGTEVKATDDTIKVNGKDLGNESADKSEVVAEGDFSFLGRGGWISLAAYTKADISTQVSGNLYITTIRAVGNKLVEESSHNHELKSEDSAEMMWSPSGKYLMVLGQSTVDLAGERYGSTSNCLLYNRDGTFIRRVNAQTTHDARWCPIRDEFIVMEGNMPCDITLFDATCKPLFEFPKSYRNTIKWNPLGNMVALCGFGNLAGEICFWYRKESNEYEQIIHLKEPCTVVSEWSLDSKYFMAASTFPRMKVDNFLKIFNHEGDLIEHQKFHECYDVCWMGVSASEADFVRPRVRNTVQRKALYRPKMHSKEDDVKSAADGVSSKIQAGLGVSAKALKSRSSSPLGNPPAHMVAQVEGGIDSSSWNPLNSTRMPTKGTIPLGNSRFPRDTRYKGSLFSNDYGDKNDPSVDLLDAFKHVFALSQSPAPSKPVQYEAVSQSQPRRPEEPQAMENPQVAQDRRATYNNRPAGETTDVQENAAKSLSMLMRIKNQLHCEKSKPLQQSILDEVQLLKLLLEAKKPVGE